MGRQGLVGKEKEPHIAGKVIGPSEDTPVVCACLDSRQWWDPVKNDADV